MVITPNRFIPAFGMMAAIFIVSSQPGDHLCLPSFLSFDKAWHMLEYAFLAATCFFAVHPTLSRQNRTSLSLLVVVFACLYGVSDEFHQSFVPLRTSSFADVIADTLGAALVAAVCWRRVGVGAAPRCANPASSSVVSL